MKCFYHSADLDGKCSAAIVRRKYPKIELIPINYGEPFPWGSIAPREPIIMVDFSLQPFAGMVRLRELTDALVWVDHHKSALSDAEAAGWRETPDRLYEPDAPGTVIVPGLRRDGIGACALVWEYLFPLERTPLAVRLLAEYDVWDHHDPMCLPFQYGMRLEAAEPSAHIWESMLGGDVDEEARVGRAGGIVLRYQREQYNGHARATCFETTLDGMRLIAANYGPASSQFFDGLFDPAKHDAMCLFQWRPKTRAWSVSLYSANGGPDVGAVAKMRGGGGHRGAAGFQCAELPFALEVAP